MVVIMCFELSMHILLYQPQREVPGKRKMRNMPEKRNIGVPFLTMQKAPSLVDLCVKTTIDNVRYLGDVGETDLHLLDRILPHCTFDQLMHVENSTKVRYTNYVFFFFFFFL